MEQKLRQLLGDCMFTIANLQDQVEQLQKKIKELEDNARNLPDSDKPSL